MWKAQFFLLYDLLIILICANHIVIGLNWCRWNHIEREKIAIDILHMIRTLIIWNSYDFDGIKCRKLIWLNILMNHEYYDLHL